MTGFNYLLEVSFISAILFGLYHLLFRKETFFRLNRYLLLSSLFISFLLPLIQIPLSADSGSAQLLLNLPQLANRPVTGSATSVLPETGLSAYSVLLWVYVAGLVILIIRGLFHATHLSRIRYKNPTVKQGKERLILTDTIPSFSFFRWVFIKHLPDEDQAQKVVLQHELAHARQFHSIDLIVVELVQAVLWVNPFIFLYKRSLQEVHEYLADQAVLSKGIALRAYVDTILEEIMHNHSYKLASHLKSSTLKKRVIMATKQSSKKASWKYLLTIPVLVFSLLSFSFTEVQVKEQDKGKKKNAPTMLPIEKASIKKIAQDFGGPGEGEHPGVDFAAKLGTPIVATASGVVKKAGEKGEYGNLVLIAHDDHFATLYAHMDKIKVKDGQKVKAGQVIGTVGNTGKSSAPHLHYEVWYDGDKVNPMKLIQKQKQMQVQKQKQKVKK